MLVTQNDQFNRVGFTNEAELEGVVQQYAELLFGTNIIYLPQARIQTDGGAGTIPDAIVIDVEDEVWYVVEAELAHHGTWPHIAPQVTRQLVAVAAPASREQLVQLALKQVMESDLLREKFSELGISDLQIQSRIHQILLRPPTVAIPIDSIPRDLTEWAQVLRAQVKIWVIEKYSNINDPSRIVFSLPDDNLPTLRTVASGSGGPANVRATGNQPLQRLVDSRPDLIGQPVYMEHKPRGGVRRRFDGVLRADGVEVDGKISLPSPAALSCIRQLNPEAQAVNGWTKWRLSTGERLADALERLIEQPNELDDSVRSSISQGAEVENQTPTI